MPDFRTQRENKCLFPRVFGQREGDRGGLIGERSGKHPTEGGNEQRVKVGQASGVIGKGGGSKIAPWGVYVGRHAAVNLAGIVTQFNP